MGLTLEQKQAVVAEVATVAAAAPAAIAERSTAVLNVAEMTELRRSARECGHLSQGSPEYPGSARPGGDAI